jgi:ribonuclease Z
VTHEGKVIKNSVLTLPPYRCRSYAFCTDTLYFKKLETYLKDIDLLYYETTFSDQDKKLAKANGHSTSVQAATLARNARVGRLLMGHFSTRYKSVAPLLAEARAIFPESFAVEDGEKYEVSLERTEGHSSNG